MSCVVCASYFDSDENFSKLVAEIESWRGTKFWESAAGRANKGVYADCVTWAHQVMVNVGAITPIAFPNYVIRSGGQEMLLQLLRVMSSIPEMLLVWHSTRQSVDEFDKTLRRGDVLLGTTGDRWHHLAIYVGDNTLWHCLVRHGVCTGNVKDPMIRSKLHSLWRVKAR